MGQNGGKRDGAGRPKGALGKRTKEALLEVAQTIDAAREGKIELAKAVLDRMMKVAEGATSLHRPVPPAQVLAGAVQTGDWPLFGEWFDRTVYCASKLAQYQSPTFKAIAVHVEQNQPTLPTPTGGNIVNIDDPEALARVYKRRIAGVG